MELENIISYYYSKNPFLRWLFRRRLTLAAELAEEKLTSRKKINVVDLGFGQGLLFDALHKYKGQMQLFGVESEPNAAKIKDKFKNVDIKIADLRETGYQDAFFDVIFCLDTLEHFQSLAEPINEIKRILKPDGALIISIPTESAIYKMARFLVAGTTSMVTAPCSPHYHRAKDIEKFAAQNGLLEIEKVHLPPIPCMSLFHVISFRKK